MAEWLHWTGVPEFAASLEATVVRASVEARAAVVEGAAELEWHAKSRASGRPGPEVVSGTLRRGITHDPVTPWGVRGWETRVGPTAIYSRRIELGFRGADSLGRVYNQGPYPYFEPAWREVAPWMLRNYAAHWSAALTGL